MPKFVGCGVGKGRGVGKCAGVLGIGVGKCVGVLGK